MRAEPMVRQAHHKNDGVALLIVVFVIALLAAVAISMLQLNT
jgi:DNA-binding transcriptional regulator of glucitol operon